MTFPTYFTLYLIDAPKAFAEAIEQGYVFDDKDNDVRLTGRIRYTDTHTEGLTFQLWNQARDEGVSIDVVDRDQSASSVLIGIEQRPRRRRRAKDVRRRSVTASRQMESSLSLATVSAAVQVEHSSKCQDRSSLARSGTPPC